jgi:hypothetical protein
LSFQLIIGEDILLGQFLMFQYISILDLDPDPLFLL